MTSSILQNLAPRALFGDDSPDICRSYSEDNQAAPISGMLTFHKLITYIAAAGLAITCLSTFVLVLGHIFSYREPRIQKQLIRMILIAPAFAIFCFIGVASYHLTPYFPPIAELYEAFALVALFYLMIAMLTPDAPTWTGQHAFFADPANGGSAAFTKTYIMVMQLLPGRIITTVAIIIVSAVNCTGGKSYQHAHTIINIVNGIQAALALVALFRFLMRWTRQLKAADNKIVGKLACFKLIVAIQFVQRIIFSILTQAGALDGSKTLSYNDLNFGLSNVLTVVEATVVAVMMVVFYWPGQYRNRTNALEAGKVGEPTNMAQKQKLSPIRAAWDAIDLLDVLAGVVRAVKLFGAQRRGGSRRNVSQQASQQAYYPAADDSPPQYGAGCARQ